MSESIDYGSKLERAHTSASDLLKQFEEIYKTLPASKCTSKCKAGSDLLKIMSYLDSKILPKISKLKKSLTVSKKQQIRESFGIKEPICDPKIEHELESCHKLLESVRMQAAKPVESACVKVAEPAIESIHVLSADYVVGAIKPKRSFEMVEPNYNVMHDFKKNRLECSAAVQLTSIKDQLGGYIINHTRIHPAIYPYFMSKRDAFNRCCSKCRESNYTGRMVVRIDPRESLSYSEIQEIYYNDEKREDLIRFIKYLMRLRENENVVFISVSLHRLFSCMEIVIQKFRK